MFTWRCAAGPSLAVETFCVAVGLRARWRLELGRRRQRPRRRAKKGGPSVHFALDAGRPQPVRNLQSQAGACQRRPDAGDLDLGGRHRSGRTLPTASPADGARCARAFDDQQGGEPSAGQLSHAHGLPADRQRAVPGARGGGRSNWATPPAICPTSYESAAGCATRATAACSASPTTPSRWPAPVVCRRTRRRTSTSIAMPAGSRCATSSTT